MSLTIEQLEFLADKGFTAAEIVQFAKMADRPVRSANAERQARYRARQKSVDATESVTSNVICNATSNITPPLSLPPNENISNPPTHTPGNNTRARKGAGTPAKPDGVQDQTWIDFLDLRKRKRAALNETALAGIEREAKKAGWSLECALAKCLARGWQGFDAEWVKGERPPNDDAANDDPLTRRLMARKAAREAHV